MKSKPRLAQIIFIVGVITMLTGAFDPLEGSVIIVAGSFMVFIASLVNKDRHRKLFLTAFVMILTGVVLMFYLSSLGGFGKDGLSWWYGILIVPYPAA
jgi:uncharacterized membrane protein YozB (DUF420 family)